MLSNSHLRNSLLGQFAQVFYYVEKPFRLHFLVFILIWSASYGAGCPSGASAGFLVRTSSGLHKRGRKPRRNSTITFPSTYKISHIKNLQSDPVLQSTQNGYCTAKQMN